MAFLSIFRSRRAGFQRAIVATVLVLAVGLVAGCGRTAQRGARVIGAVTVGGKPASGATVMFFDDANQCVATGPVGDDGTYVAVDVPQKSLKVAVGEGVTSGLYAVKPPPPGSATVPGSPSVPAATIPKKYQKADTSGLTVTVEGKEQKLDLSLE